MDISKSKAPTNTITRNTYEMGQEVGSIYEMVMIIAKRSNQISSELKDKLDKKLQEFASFTSNLEEIYENKEQIEISRYYERLPKSTLVAIEEYLEKEIYYRKPASKESPEKSPK